VTAGVVAIALVFVALQPGVTLHAREGFADLPGVRLWFTDSGGSGGPVVLLHPNTGTSEIWEPQIAALERAGFRAIAFDHRGWGKSTADSATGAQPGHVAEDLDRTRAAEDRARGVARLRVELGGDPDGDGAGQERAPDVRRRLEDVEALAADGLDNNGHYQIMFNLAVILNELDRDAEALTYVDRFMSETKTESEQAVRVKGDPLNQPGRCDGGGGGLLGGGRATRARRARSSSRASSGGGRTRPPQWVARRRAMTRGRE